MPLFSLIANDPTVGATIGTFDPINSRNGNLQLTTGSDAIVGLTFVGAATAQTTGTAVMGRLRVTGRGAGIVNEDFAVGETHGGGVATQSMAWATPAEWIPVDWLPPENNVSSGLIINLSFSQMGIEPADTWEVQAGVAHLANSRPPDPWAIASLSGGHLALQGSASSDGGSTADARTSLTSATIPGRFTKMVSWRGLQAQDALAPSAEAALAFVDIQSTIGDLTPQEWPMSGIGASLAGTLVGGGQHIFQPAMPFYMEKDGNDRTVEPFADVLTALNAANAFGWGIGLRY